MEIKRTRAGIIMPQRNAFDFVDKPSFNVHGEEDGQVP